MKKGMAMTKGMTMTKGLTMTRRMTTSLEDSETILLDKDEFRQPSKSFIVGCENEIEFEDITTEELSGLLESMGRKKKMIESIKSECTEERIRQRFNVMDAKEIKYDPQLYSVVATEALAIHAKLKKLFGTDVIQLHNPDFTEDHLNIMLEAEEEEERQAEAARKKKGEMCAWNVQKKEKFKTALSKMLVRTECNEGRSASMFKSSSEKKGKRLQIWKRPMFYDHRMHTFEFPESKYQATGSIWDDDEDDDLLKADHVSLLFEEADNIVTNAHVPKRNFQLKKRGCELEISESLSLDKNGTKNSNNAKRRMKKEKNEVSGNNSVNEKPVKENDEKWLKLMNPSLRQQKKAKSRYSVLEARHEQRSRESVTEEIEDDGLGAFEPH